MHLEAAKDVIVSILAEDKSYDVTVSNPGETHSPAVVVAFVNGPVTGKAFSKVGMQMDFISAGTAGSKHYWV